jgi:hypothetical protein
MREVAWVYRPVTVSLKGGARTHSLLVTNRRSFVGLDDLTATWELVVAGEVVTHGRLRMPKVAPRTSVGVPLPCKLPAGDDEVQLTVADGSCVGTNRHDPAGPADPEVPVLLVRDRDSQKFLAAMVVCSMHPTVLHEDSTLISGDFPVMARRYLQEHVLGGDCPILYHMGFSGNQSPRHVTRSNTFDEAARLERSGSR